MKTSKTTTETLEHSKGSRLLIAERLLTLLPYHLNLASLRIQETGNPNTATLRTMYYHSKISKLVKKQ